MLSAQYNLATASTLVIGGRGRLLGYSLYENAGSPAVAAVSLLDGTSSGGQFLARCGLTASGVDTKWFGPQGIAFRQGLYIGAFTGSLTGNLYFLSETLLSSDFVELSNGGDYKLKIRLTQSDIDNYMGSFG